MKTLARLVWERLLKVYTTLLIRHLLKLLIREFREFVIETVNVLDEEALLDEEKRRYAFQIVKGYLAQRCQQVPDHVINLAIELAVLLSKRERKALH